MMFGDPTTFAIESDVDSVANNWISVKFRLWIRGDTVGDYAETSSLANCVYYMRRFVDLSEKRISRKFDNLSCLDVFDIVYNSSMLTVAPNSTLVESLANDNWYGSGVDLIDEQNSSQLREIFHVDDIGQSSFIDKYNIILVATSLGVQRIIWRNLSDMVVRGCSLPYNTFENSARLFLEWASNHVRC